MSSSSLLVLTGYQKICCNPGKVYMSPTPPLPCPSPQEKGCFKCRWQVSMPHGPPFHSQGPRTEPVIVGQASPCEISDCFQTITRNGWMTSSLKWPLVFQGQTQNPVLLAVVCGWYSFKFQLWPFTRQLAGSGRRITAFHTLLSWAPSPLHPASSQTKPS